MASKHMQKPQSIYVVKGMHCASCASIIEKKVKAMPGVRGVSVNFATEKAMLDLDQDAASLAAVNDAIAPLGYAIVAPQAEIESRAHHVHDEASDLAHRTAFALPVALFVFFVMMWDIAAQLFASVPNVPLPMDMMNVVGFIFASIILFWVGYSFVAAIPRFIAYRVANMDTLVGIGTMTAYLYSATITLLPGVRVALNLPEYTYFDVVIVVIGFVMFGKHLESRSKKRTGEAIEKLIGLQAKTALVERDGEPIEVSLAEVQVGDVLIVKPGATVPVDGRVIDGSTTIDESMISGESVPVDKQEGDTVIGGTLNKQGSIRYVATQVGEDTMLAQIIRMVEEAQGSRAPIQGLADRVSAVFVPVVLAIAVVTFVTWLVVGVPLLGVSVALSYGLLAFVGVLVIACPCALGLATPTAIIVGVGKGAEHGVLVKDAEALELLARVDTIVMDKTGTLTKGELAVTEVVATSGAYTADAIMRYAGSVESRSEHPLGAAITHAARVRAADALPEVTQFIAREGVGVEGYVDGVHVIVQKPDRAVSHAQIEKLEEAGNTVVRVVLNGEEAGYIALADTLKDASPDAVRALRAHGIDVVLLTGDNERTARHVGTLAGIDTVIAGVLPQEKAEHVRALKVAGRTVAMVGDGVNDAPALAEAHVGIAMATGTDVAIESASITLLHGDIARVVSAVAISRATMRTVKQNLFFAFIYNVIGIPVAAGVLYPLWGIFLSPIFAGLAMAGSSVSVVGNALRLKALRIRL